MFPRDMRAPIFKADKLGFNHWHYVKLGMLSSIVIRPAISLKSRWRRTVNSHVLSQATLPSVDQIEPSKSLRMKTQSAARPCFLLRPFSSGSTVFSVNFGSSLPLSRLRAPDKPKLRRVVLFAQAAAIKIAWAGTQRLRGVIVRVCSKLSGLYSDLVAHRSLPSNRISRRHLDRSFLHCLLP